MELEKITKSEYEKYRQMDFIAHRSRIKENVIYFLVGLIAFVFFASLGLYILMSPSLNPLIDYTNATVQAAHLNFTTNASIATSITKLSSNSTLQLAYLLHSYALISLVQNTLIGTLLVFLGFVSFIILIVIPNEHHVRTYISLLRALNEKAAIYQRLTEYGYTQKEIEWYFEVRSKIQELEKVVN